jgi:polyphosphate kinase 2 (PPK2 family)
VGWLRTSFGSEQGDPRSFKVHAIAAPTDREKSRHYLQRFWERLLEHGQIVVFEGFRRAGLC